MSRCQRSVPVGNYPHDFGYWLKFNEAWMESWKAEKGPFNECRAEVVGIQEQKRELEAEWEREQREFDRWYADLKRRSGQGGGTRSCDGDGDGICNE